jgi:hypothetical protein
MQSTPVTNTGRPEHEKETRTMTQPADEGGKPKPGGKPDGRKKAGAAAKGGRGKSLPNSQKSGTNSQKKK